MISILGLFKKKEVTREPVKIKEISQKSSEKVTGRKGEIGEYKIDIQLAQLPKTYKYLSDIMIKNPNSVSGYSQIDHTVITPYGIFVIETKNYQGTIYGGKNRKTWIVNGKFKMMNPIIQNYGHIKALKALVDISFHNHFISLVSFTKRCRLKIDMDIRRISANEMVIYDVFLSETIERKISRTKLKHKEPFLSQNDIMYIYQTLVSANVTDPIAREEHNNIIKEKKTNASFTEKCVVCNKPVSEKVKKYCQYNKKFKGKIYCYKHQQYAD